MKNNKSLSPNLKTFVETHKTLNSILDDETFLGVFDADGSILICIDLKKKSSVSSKPFNLRIVYEFAQSNSKKDLVLKVANKFDGHVSSNSQKTTFRVTATTLVGEKIRQLLLKFNPKQPGRFYAFLLSEYILRLLKKK